MKRNNTDRQISPTNPLSALLGYQLRRASVAMMANLAADLNDISLRPSEASILLLVQANPGITQSMIGSILGINRANMAPLTALLVGRGLIDRTPADGRSHGLHLTKAGTALAKKAARCIETLETRVLAKMPEKVRSTLVGQLRAIWDETPD